MCNSFLQVSPSYFSVFSCNLVERCNGLKAPSDYRKKSIDSIDSNGWKSKSIRGKTEIVHFAGWMFTTEYHIIVLLLAVALKRDFCRSQAQKRTIIWKNCAHNKLVALEKWVILISTSTSATQRRNLWTYLIFFKRFSRFDVLAWLLILLCTIQVLNQSIRCSMFWGMKFLVCISFQYGELSMNHIRSG